MISGIPLRHFEYRRAGFRSLTAFQGAAMPVRLVATCLLVAGLSRTAGAQAPLPSVRDSIQFRFAEVGSRPGPRGYTDPRTGRGYVLTDTVVLDGRGIDSVEVRRHGIGTDTTVDVVARLRPSAVTGFSAATANHIGRTLVVTIGDRVVATGVIQSRLGPLVPLVTDVGRSTADSLAKRINKPATPAHKAS